MRVSEGGKLRRFRVGGKENPGKVDGPPQAEQAESLAAAPFAGDFSRQMVLEYMCGARARVVASGWGGQAQQTESDQHDSGGGAGSLRFHKSVDPF